MVTTEIIRASEELRARGATTEEIICYFRDSGLSVLESIQVLMKLHDMPLADAKRAVHYSETWADLRPEHDRFHDRIEQAANMVADETKPK